MTNMMMNIFEAQDAVMEIMETTNKMDKETFMLTICMLMEEWCKAHDSDIVQDIEKIKTLIIDVNNECGKY